MKIDELRKIKDEIILDYRNFMPICDLCCKYKTSFYYIKQILEENNIEKTKVRIKRWKKFNQNWLDSIDCQEKLYFLGFFAADGTLLKERQDIRFHLALTDKEILVRFKELLESESIIREEKPRQIKSTKYFSHGECSINFHSKYFCDKINELGFPSNKTYILEFPGWIDKEQFWPFMRGYFDGDGCFSNYKRGQKHITITSSKNFLNELQKRLSEDYGIRGTISKASKTDERVQNLNISNKDNVKMFMDSIYNNSSIHLSRKYKKYADYYL